MDANCMFQRTVAGVEQIDLSPLAEAVSKLENRFARLDKLAGEMLATYKVNRDRQIFFKPMAPDVRQEAEKQLNDIIESYEWRYYEIVQRTPTE